VFDGMLLRVTVACGLAGGEALLRLATGLHTIASRASLGLLARRVTHQGATATAERLAPARARRRRRGGGVGAPLPVRERANRGCYGVREAAHAQGGYQ
jgi:hypothetical protein